MKADLLQKYMSGLSDGKMCTEAKKQAAAKRSKAAQLKPTDDFSKQMRVSEMRDMLAELGSECKGCSEKPEFVAALKQAVAARR
eukprot:16290-Heterococcus_DN1.PRE.3